MRARTCERFEHTALDPQKRQQAEVVRKAESLARATRQRLLSVPRRKEPATLPAPFQLAGASSRSLEPTDTDMLATGLWGKSSARADGSALATLGQRNRDRLDGTVSPVSQIFPQLPRCAWIAHEISAHIWSAGLPAAGCSKCPCEGRSGESLGSSATGKSLPLPLRHASSYAHLPAFGPFLFAGGAKWTREAPCRLCPGVPRPPPSSRNG